MGCKAVSISRSMGAGGEEVGRSVAAELGFRYVDNEIITQAAERAGVSPEVVEQNERTQPLLIRILDAIAKAPIEPEAMMAQATNPVDLTSAYEDLIEQAIVETAQKGKVVIVAHGASVPLTGMSDVLRVFITASESVRADRIAAQDKLDQKQALSKIQDSDKERHRYFERIYEQKEELSTHYDLVLSTDVLTTEQAAKIAIAAARTL